MDKLLMWQWEIIEAEKKYTDEELIDEILSANGLAWDEQTSTKDSNRAAWESEYLASMLKKRLEQLRNALSDAAEIVDGVSTADGEDEFPKIYHGDVVLAKDWKKTWDKKFPERY